MFLLVIYVVLLPTQHLCFDMQKFYWAYAASLAIYCMVEGPVSVETIWHTCITTSRPHRSLVFTPAVLPV